MSRDVIVRDLSSGRIHRRTLVNGQLMGFEADNADDAGESVVVGSDVLANAEPGELCLRCFPDIPADEDDAA
jgi:hypothetical protein